MKHNAQIFFITSPTKEIIKFFNQIFFVHLIVAQKHARAVNKYLLPCQNRECREHIRTP